MPEVIDQPSDTEQPLDLVDEVDIDIDQDALERLNPRVRVVWIVESIITAVVVGVIAGGVSWFFDYPYLEIGGGVFALLASLGIIHAILRYRIWGFLVREDSLYLQRGVLFRIQTVVPYVRIQHVDTSRSPVERAVGLATSVVYTAGSRGADVTIPGLHPDRARELQERLKGLANVTGRDDSV